MPAPGRGGVSLFEELPTVLFLFEDLFVKPDRTAGDGVPAELLHRAYPPGLTHPPGPLRIADHRVQCSRESRLEVVVHRDEYPGTAVVHDLGDAAHPGGHHRRAAG